MSGFDDKPGTYGYRHTLAVQPNWNSHADMVQLMEQQAARERLQAKTTQSIPTNKPGEKTNVVIDEKPIFASKRISQWENTIKNKNLEVQKSKLINSGAGRQSLALNIPSQPTNTANDINLEEILQPINSPIKQTKPQTILKPVEPVVKQQSVNPTINTPAVIPSPIVKPQPPKVIQQPISSVKNQQKQPAVMSSQTNEQATKKAAIRWQQALYKAQQQKRNEQKKPAFLDVVTKVVQNTHSTNLANVPVRENISTPAPVISTLSIPISPQQTGEKQTSQSTPASSQTLAPWAIKGESTIVKPSQMKSHQFIKSETKIPQAKTASKPQANSGVQKVTISYPPVVPSAIIEDAPSHMYQSAPTHVSNTSPQKQQDINKTTSSITPGSNTNITQKPTVMKLADRIKMFEASKNQTNKPLVQQLKVQPKPTVIQNKPVPIVSEPHSHAEAKPVAVIEKKTETKEHQTHSRLPTLQQKRDQSDSTVLINSPPKFSTTPTTSPAEMSKIQEGIDNKPVVASNLKNMWENAISKRNTEVAQSRQSWNSFAKGKETIKQTVSNTQEPIKQTVSNTEVIKEEQTEEHLKQDVEQIDDIIKEFQNKDKHQHEQKAYVVTPEVQVRFQERFKVAHQLHVQLEEEKKINQLQKTQTSKPFTQINPHVNVTEEQNTEKNVVNVNQADETHLLKSRQAVDLNVNTHIVQEQPIQQQPIQQKPIQQQSVQQQSIQQQPIQHQQTQQQLVHQQLIQHEQKTETIAQQAVPEAVSHVTQPQAAGNQVYQPEHAQAIIQQPVVQVEKENTQIEKQDVVQPQPIHTPIVEEVNNEQQPKKKIIEQEPEQKQEQAAHVEHVKEEVVMVVEPAREEVVTVAYIAQLPESMAKQMSQILEQTLRNRQQALIAPAQQSQQQLVEETITPLTEQSLPQVQQVSVELKFTANKKKKKPIENFQDM